MKNRIHNSLILAVVAALSFGMSSCSTLTTEPNTGPDTKAAIAQLAATTGASAVISKAKSPADREAKAIQIANIADVLTSIGDGATTGDALSAIVIANSPKDASGVVLPHWVALGSAVGLVYDQYVAKGVSQSAIVAAIAKGLKAGAAPYI